MGKTLTNIQRESQYRSKGKPVLSLEFDVFPDMEVSMWAHTRHDVPFSQMLAAFEGIQRHLSSFIADQGMCPFNPSFGKIINEENPNG